MKADVQIGFQRRSSLLIRIHGEGGVNNISIFSAVFIFLRDHSNIKTKSKLYIYIIVIFIYI